MEPVPPQGSSGREGLSRRGAGGQGRQGGPRAACTDTGEHESGPKGPDRGPLRPAEARPVLLQGRRTLMRRDSGRRGASGPPDLTVSARSAVAGGDGDRGWGQGRGCGGRGTGTRVGDGAATVATENAGLERAPKAGVDPASRRAHREEPRKRGTQEAVRGWASPPRGVGDGSRRGEYVSAGSGRLRAAGGAGAVCTGGGVRGAGHV